MSLKIVNKFAKNFCADIINNVKIDREFRSSSAYQKLRTDSRFSESEFKNYVNQFGRDTFAGINVNIKYN